MKAKIYRVIQEDGTFGLLVLNGEPHGWTVEKPWRDNIPYESCIPEGDYTCNRVYSDRYGETFEVSDVQDRTLIRFHWGSFPTDYKGCIGLGKKFGKIGTRQALYDTKDKFDEFMKYMDGENEFSLEIINSWKT